MAADRLPDPAEPHEFVGRLDRWCEVCSKPDLNAIHIVRPVSAAVSPAEPRAGGEEVAGVLVGRPEETRASGHSGRATGTGGTAPTIPAADPSVSPAVASGLVEPGRDDKEPAVSHGDTIRREDVEAFIQSSPWREQVPHALDTPVADWGTLAWARFAAALLAVGERDKAEIERLRDRAVCSGCGSDVGESGECPYDGCDDGEMIPASDLAVALRTLRDRFTEDQQEWTLDWNEAKAERERDRQRIAQLTEALERIVEADSVSVPVGGFLIENRYYKVNGSPFPHEIARAVLAGEEDTANG